MKTLSFLATSSLLAANSAATLHTDSSLHNSLLKRDAFANSLLVPLAPRQAPNTNATTTAPLTSDEANRFKIRIHQIVAGAQSTLEWTLLDSSGAVLLGPSSSNTIPASTSGTARAEISIEVSDQASKDNTRVQFIMRTSARGGCFPTWNMGRTAGTESSFSWGCEPPLDLFSQSILRDIEMKKLRIEDLPNMPNLSEDIRRGLERKVGFGCDDNKKTNWAASNGGFERTFECFGTNI